MKAWLAKQLRHGSNTVNYLTVQLNGMGQKDEHRKHKENKEPKKPTDDSSEHIPTEEGTDDEETGPGNGNGSNDGEETGGRGGDEGATGPPPTEESPTPTDPPQAA